MTAGGTRECADCGMDTYACMMEGCGMHIVETIVHECGECGNVFGSVPDPCRVCAAETA